MDENPTPLRRTLGLPLLVFYGLGVTIGAGIFALIGEILLIAGDHAAPSFLLAGITAAATARAFALLAPRYPKAGGSAIYIREGFGKITGLIAGLGVVLTAVISSATIAVALAGYVGTLVPIPPPLTIVVLIAAMTGVAAWGIKESLVFAAVITIIEVGTLTIVAVLGVPVMADAGGAMAVFSLPGDLAALNLTVAGAAIAFFAFIGFEDIVNVAEEARSPERTLGWAIGITLLVSTLLYVIIAAVAVAVPERKAVAGSPAPLADLFALISGWPAWPISIIAAISMINGILVQIVMASRVLYGMARDGLIAAWFGRVDQRRRTPSVSTAVVGAAITGLAMIAPLVGLARATGYVTLGVFVLVNLTLVRLASQGAWRGRPSDRYWGLAGAALSAGLLVYDFIRLLGELYG
jgi:amino acid transporter